MHIKYIFIVKIWKKNGNIFHMYYLEVIAKSHQNNLW